MVNNKKKDLPVSCKAYPGEDMTDPLLVEWCKNNQHIKMCLMKCKLFPANGPEVSIYQKNKSRKGKAKCLISS